MPPSPIRPTPSVYVLEHPTPPTTPTTPTALTAFVGRTAMGPVDTPVRIQSPGDFAATFGGAWAESELPGALQDFFDNGGTDAIVVRLFASPGDAEALHLDQPVGAPIPANARPDGCARVGIGPAPPVGDTPTPSPPPYAGVPSITLVAANPGSWGNRISARIDPAGTLAPGGAPDGSTAETFDLSLTFAPSDPEQVAVTESFPGVTLAEAGGAQRLDRVLAATSRLASWEFVADVDPGFLASWQAARTAMQHDPKAVFQTALPTGAGGSDGYHLQSPLCFTSPALQATHGGIYALDGVEQIDLLVLPRDRPDADNPLTYADVFAYVERRKAFWILESPLDPKLSFAPALLDGSPPATGLIDAAFDTPGLAGRNAAVYFPDVQILDPLSDGQPRRRGPAGMVAGICARTDDRSGVWQSPAGQYAALQGVVGPALDDGTVAGKLVSLTNAQCSTANEVGIDCLMTFPTLGSVVWGARTLRGATALDDPFQYVSVRRLTLWIDKAVEASTRWAVFQPNDAALWSALREQVGAFLDGLWSQGAFMGAIQGDAYFVQCDASTTTPADQLAGVLNLVVGFAPVRPAEFTVVQVQLQVASRETR
ncbi:MAG: phage tail sheath subtilisin-like domain-containing protein [Myxococcota bacterium]